MSSFNDDRFSWLEKMTNEKGGATLDEICSTFGIRKITALAWLDYWQNYDNRPRDIVQHFITRVEPSDNNSTLPLYKVGPDWWGERFNNGVGEEWHDQHDISGIDPLQVSLGMIKTRTDSVTGKRTAAGKRKTGMYMAYIAACDGGITTAHFAEKFGIGIRSASTMLSRWKAQGKIKTSEGLWHLEGQKRKDVEVILTVKGDYTEDGNRRSVEQWEAIEKTKSEELKEDYNE